MKYSLSFNLRTMALTAASVWLLSSVSVNAFAQAKNDVQATASATQSNATTANSTVDTDAVKKKFMERFGELPVKRVQPTPYGLFEVQLGKDIIYTDADVNFVFDGRIIDAVSRRDLTQARINELSAIDFNALPFDMAIKQVRGSGKRQVAIFEDPNCGYCKKLRQNIVDVDDVTLYTFMLPILSDDSVEKVKNVWCSKDRGTTWDNWMLDGKKPPKLDCEAPIQKMLDLAKSLQVQGTPAIFFADGSLVPGAISKEDFEKRLQ
jgi:thiol:disulfide interchange protein DsbC